MAPMGETTSSNVESRWGARSGTASVVTHRTVDDLDDYVMHRASLDKLLAGTYGWD